LYRCAEDNCETRATFGEPGSGRRQFCSKHAPKGMVNLERKKCSVDDCPMPPTYWHEGNRKRRFCARHAEDGMVKLDKKLCPVKGCFTSASYGVMGKKRKFCAVHAERGMVSIGGRRCAEGGCGKRANYGIAGTNKREFCAGHAAKGMVNINNQSRRGGSPQKKNASTTSSNAGPRDGTEEESDNKPAVSGDGRRTRDPSVSGEEEEEGGMGMSAVGSAEENDPVGMAVDERNSWDDPRLPVAATRDGGVWDLRGPCGVGSSSSGSFGGGGGGGNESSAAHTSHRATGGSRARSPPVAAADDGVMGGHSNVKHEEFAGNFRLGETPTSSPGKDARMGARSCSPKETRGRFPRSTSASSSPSRGRRSKRPKKVMRPWPKSKAAAVPLLLTSEGWSSWEWQPLATS
ncbi:unnamed protein product, partial [Ectocarpus fasciculatus]